MQFRQIQLGLAILSIFSVCARTGLRPSEVKSDFYAFPKFKVELLPEPVKDSPDLLASLSNESSETLVLRPPGTDKKYICNIPMSQNSNADSLPANDLEVGNSTATVDAALKALEKWTSKCLLMVVGWWMYDFCHMSHVRQYHQSQFNGPTEVEFFLGHFVTDEAIQSARIEGGDNENYLSMHIQDGTLCDVTGNPREAEVHYICPPSDREVTRLVQVKETSTCKYLITVYAGDLCHLSGFSKPQTQHAQRINCTLALSENQWQNHLEVVKQETVLRAKQASQQKQLPDVKAQIKPVLKPGAKPSLEALSKILENLLDSNVENLVQIVAIEEEGEAPKQQPSTTQTEREKSSQGTTKRQQPTVIIRDEL